MQRTNRRGFLGGMGGACLLTHMPTLLLSADGPKPTASPTGLATTGEKQARTGLVFTPEFQKHLTGNGHPESPQRCAAVINALRDAGVEQKLIKLEPRAATEEEVVACHSKAYVNIAKRDAEAGRSDLSTGDTAISERSFDVALLAAGGVCRAVDAVVEKKVQNAFCVVRPPGHHATPIKGMGFCLFNNIAIGARYAQRKHKLGKVLIADWDVHHGNGTQDIFYEDGTVLVFNTHQSPWYPGTGRADETGSGKGLGCIVNCPFPSGSGRKEIFGAFELKLMNAAKKFKPDLIMISAGFDSRVDDPLGQFRLTDEDFADLTKLMMAVASEYAEGRLVSVLEGGYNLTGLGKAAAAHVAALLKG